MEKETIINLSEEDQEYLSRIVNEKIENIKESFKEEKYSPFQKMLLEQPFEKVFRVINIFFQAYEKNKDAKPFEICARRGVGDFLKIMNEKDVKQIESHFDEHVMEYTTEVLLGLMEMAQHFNFEHGKNKQW